VTAATHPTKQAQESAEDEFAAAFSGMPPGPGLALLLGSQDHNQLDDFDVVELARSARRLASWAASIEFGAVAELSARRKAQAERVGAWDSEACEWVIDEVAAALTLSGGTAAREVAAAQQLAESLPGTLAALADGVIDRDKATVITDGVLGLSDQVAQQVEERVLPTAPTQTRARLRRAVRQAAREADPDAFAERRKAAEDDRGLELHDNGDGTCDLAGRRLPAEVGHAAFNRVNAIAQALKADGDERTIDQLRADVATALLHNQHPCLHAPARSDGVPATPLGDDPRDRPADQPANGVGGADEPGRHDDGDAADVNFHNENADAQPDADADAQAQPDAQPGAGGDDGADGGRAVAAAVAKILAGELGGLTDGLGRDARARGGQAALVAMAARRMHDALADLKSRWCVTVTGRDGTDVRHGAGAYRVPAGMRRHVESRDGTCRFPGCQRRAAKCDADHTIAYHKGGPTCPCNLASLCRRHHRLKQRPEWQLVQIWHGVLVWIAPTGYWYVTGPDG
jgi:hypothetical protein